MVLEVGARAGGLSLFLALQGYSVICSDLESPEAIARPLHRRHGVTQRIAYESLDLLDCQYPANIFDIIMFKSVLGYLKTKGNQEIALKELHRILKPGGVLLFAENAAGSRLHKYLRSKFITRTPHWRYVTIDEIQQMCRIFPQSVLETHGFLGLFGWNESLKNILAMVDQLIIRVIPQDWRYIILVAAHK
jgi:2-polyprenyl-3-methyl-5-hydroxy-6-metoxy-1,4-benzoquinol methylase